MFTCGCLPLGISTYYLLVTLAQFFDILFPRIEYFTIILPNKFLDISEPLSAINVHLSVIFLIY